MPEQFIHIDPVAQDPDVPTNPEDFKCDVEDCPGELGWEAGYGMAGGGMGLYMYCPKCGAITSKTQDIDPGQEADNG